MTTDAVALSRRIALTTGAAWIAGVLAFAVLSIVVSHRGQQASVDSQLRAHALAAYGLAWWDSAGVFHDELLRKETELIGGEVRVSLATADRLVFGPPVTDRARLVARAMDTLDEVWVDHPGERTLAIASYDDNDQVIGAVIATLPTGAARQATVRFATATAAAALILSIVGLFMSGRLSARILAALHASIAERERILAGAAHELRTPMATLLALVDTTPPGEEEQVLPVVRRTVAGASTMVERLLTWSRLADASPNLEPVRLDLLVELCLEDDEPLQAEATTVDGDVRLLEVAVRNLLQNARTHGGGVTSVRVASGRVEVHDRGPGIAGEHLLAPFTKSEGSQGSGLGLALVQRIAHKHHGRLDIAPVVALVLPVRGGEVPATDLSH